MNAIKQLPNQSINGSGRVDKKFLELKIYDFHHACEWVNDLPYGYNSSHNDPFIVFTERRGICTTKHGVIALLAQEHDLDIHKMLGFYKLDGKTVPGTDKILRKHGLSYIPQIHCFLGFHTCFVDLTEDDCHARKRRLDDFDITFRVKPDINEMEELTYYRLGLEYYMMSNAKLAKMQKDHLVSILQECDESHKRLCDQTPKGNPRQAEIWEAL
jgi:hypothetical protein